MRIQCIICDKYFNQRSKENICLECSKPEREENGNKDNDNKRIK